MGKNCNKEKLKFGDANAKLIKLVPYIPRFIKQLGFKPEFEKHLATFSKLSGWTCPESFHCKSKAVVDHSGKRHIEDGKNTKWRCFSASAETQYDAVYNSRKHNTDLVRIAKTRENIFELIKESLPEVNCIRISVGGDFSCQAEFDAWIDIAKIYPTRLFYAYTKSLSYWIVRLNEIPNNFILTASFGGRKDNCIEQYNLRYAKVVFSQYEAKKLKLQLDDTDYHAACPNNKNKSFALLLHAQQPPNTEASKAWQRIKSTHGGYSRKKKNIKI